MAAVAAMAAPLGDFRKALLRVCHNLFDETIFAADPEVLDMKRIVKARRSMSAFLVKATAELVCEIETPV